MDYDKTQSQSQPEPPKLDATILLKSILKLSQLLEDVISLNRYIDLNRIEYSVVSECSQQYADMEVAWEVAREIVSHAVNLNIHGIYPKSDLLYTTDLLYKNDFGRLEPGIIDTHKLIKKVTAEIDKLYEKQEEEERSKNVQPQ